VEGIDADGTAPGALWSHLTKWMKKLRNNLKVLDSTMTREGGVSGINDQSNRYEFAHNRRSFKLPLKGGNIML
jgi:hypothetical protein